MGVQPELGGATLLLNHVATLQPRTSGPGPDEDIYSFVARLEQMQLEQRSPQQPNVYLDDELQMAMLLRPDWRARMAVVTKSPNLRKKILSLLPEGGRAVGSSTLGFTHPWRQKVPDTFTDHNWPKAATHSSGLHFLPGGDGSHDRLLRCAAEHVAHSPILSRSASYTVPRTKRFPGTKDHSGEVDSVEVQKRGTPGPGSYFRSEPRGAAFSVDDGETVVLGANHICPWKKSLGHNINPNMADATSLTSAPCYTFSKTRRSVSETSLGHGLQVGGPAKTDSGCLSPGPIYEHYGTFRPAQASVVPGTLKRRTPSTRPARKIRMIPVAPLPVAPVQEPRLPSLEQTTP